MAELTEEQKQIIESIATDKNFISSIKDALNNLIDAERQKLEDIKKDLEQKNEQERELWDKYTKLTYSEEKSELFNKRQAMKVLINYKEKQLLMQKNIVKALENGGDIAEITDEEGFKHPNIPNFTKVKTDNIVFDIDNINSEPLPNYIPYIDEENFKNKGYVFDSIRVSNDNYLLATVKYEVDEQATAEFYQPLILVTLDQLVLIIDYYYTKAKANAIKEAEESSKRNEKYYDSLPVERREKHLNQKNFYKSLPVVVQKKITQDEYDALSLEEKEKLYKPYKRYNAKRLVSKLDETQMWGSFHELYRKFLNKDAWLINVKGIPQVGIKKGYGLYANSETAEYWRWFRDLVNYKIKDIKIQRENLSESYKAALETSFGESNTSDVLRDEFGFLVKRQNGDKIKPEEVEQIKDAWVSVREAVGELRDSFLENSIKISHSANKQIFASKAIGVFVPDMMTIGVSMKYGETQFKLTLAHELGHFIDYLVGKINGKRWGTDDYESISGKIAFAFRNNMNKPKNLQTDYINATTECWARCIEQFFGYKILKENALLKHSYKELDREYPIDTADDFVSNEKFEKNVLPLLNQFFETYKDLFKYNIETKKDTDMPIMTREPQNVEENIEINQIIEPKYNVGDILYTEEGINGSYEYSIILKILKDAYWVSKYIDSFKNSIGYSRIYFDKQDDYGLYNPTIENIETLSKRFEGKPLAPSKDYDIEKSIVDEWANAESGQTQAGYGENLSNENFFEEEEEKIAKENNYDVHSKNERFIELRDDFESNNTKYSISILFYKDKEKSGRNEVTLRFLHGEDWNKTWGEIKRKQISSIEEGIKIGEEFKKEILGQDENKKDSDYQMTISKLKDLFNKYKADKNNKEITARLHGAFGNYVFNYLLKAFFQDINLFFEINAELPKKYKEFIDLNDRSYSDFAVQLIKEGINIWNHIPNAYKKVNPIKKLSYSISKEDEKLLSIFKPFVLTDDMFNSRLMMEGISFDEHGVVATDSNKLLFIPAEHEIRGTYCATKKCFQDADNVQPLEEVKEANGSGKKGGAYPKYQTIIPSNKYSVDINAYSLLSFINAFEKSNLISEQTELLILLIEEQYFGFNATHLKACIEAILKIGYSDVTISFTDNSHAVCITPKGMYDSYKLKSLQIPFALLMPMDIDGVSFNQSPKNVWFYFDCNNESFIQNGSQPIQLNPNVIEKQEMGNMVETMNKKLEEINNKVAETEAKLEAERELLEKEKQNQKKFSKVLTKLYDIDFKARNKANFESGAVEKQDTETIKKYVSYIKEYVSKMETPFDDYIYMTLEDENYHSLNLVLGLLGFYNSNHYQWAKDHEGYQNIISIVDEIQNPKPIVVEEKQKPTVDELKERISIIKKMIAKGKGNKEELEGRIVIINKMIAKYSKFEKGGEVKPNESEKFNYMMLDRLRSDCDYYLGNGGRNEKHLQQGSVDAQIKEMKRLYNSFPDDKKPEWITMKDIEEYEDKMKNI